MSISEKLKEEGCHLTPEGIETVGFTDQISDPKILLKKVLDFDLREIGAPAFPEDFGKSGTKFESLDDPVFVQLQKVRNISAPKANEESKHAPRMLKLTLTDGHLTFQAIEVEHISGLSIHTPPGTKLQLKSGPLSTAHGFLFVGPSCLRVLGGHVSHMVDKWELNRSLAKHNRGNLGGEGSPPPWIPFGQPLDGRDLQDSAFKSLQDTAKLDNVEFETQRKGAIAEAQKLSGTKKVFGGGTKPMLDTNVQKIVDAGFSEEQAENALKLTRNNADRALKNLQRREGVVEPKKERPPKQTTEAPKGRKGRSKEANDEEIGSNVKPSGKVSLFDFLEDKLPAAAETEKPSKPVETPSFQKEENKYDRNNTDRRGGYSGRGGGRGGPRISQNRHQSYASGQSGRTDYNQPQSQAYGHGENQRNYNNYQRDERPQHNYSSQQIPNEKAPRFQKKFDGEAKRQQNINMSHESPYPPNYGVPQQQMQPNYFPDRRNMNENRPPKGFYGQPTVDSITDATSALNLDTSSQNRFNTRPNVMPNYPNSYNYNNQGKTNYNNPNTFNEQNFKRNNQYPGIEKNPMLNMSNGQQPMNQSFYNPYPDNQVKAMNSQNLAQQADMMEAFRQQTSQPQEPRPTNFNNRGNGFYQSANIVGFQNASINEQARKMLAEGSDIGWNIGDRCLAKYWEDNGYYDAEITGVSSRTVVVRFLAYGNHEEVLKADCLPPNSQRRGPGREGPGGRSENGSRGGRFHQALYMPPAQRKA